MPMPETEIALKAADGTAIAARLWPRPNPRGLLVISHGLGEHGGCYRRFATDLEKHLDIDIFAFDYRGHGRSAGKPGVVRNYDDLTLDLAAALDWADRERPGLPRFLLGHSNGGLVALRAILLGGDRGLSGLILSNPALKLLAIVPTWKRLVGEVLLRLAPGITLSTGIPDEDLTLDAEALAEIAADPLRHDRISPPLFFGMKQTGASTIEAASSISLPTLMILGGSDPVIDHRASLGFFEHLGSIDKQVKVYPSLKHEPLNSTGRAEVVADIAAWLNDRLGHPR